MESEGWLSCRVGCPLSNALRVCRTYRPWLYHLSRYPQHRNSQVQEPASDQQLSAAEDISFKEPCSQPKPWLPGHIEHQTSSCGAISISSHSRDPTGSTVYKSPVTQLSSKANAPIIQHNEFMQRPIEQLAHLVCSPQRSPRCFQRAGGDGMCGCGCSVVLGGKRW
jgi:hypothetical protein